MKTNEKIYRLMNHDSSHREPRYDPYTLEEHNEQFGTSYSTIEDAVNDDPEYLFFEHEILTTSCYLSAG